MEARPHADTTKPQVPRVRVAKLYEREEEQVLLAGQASVLSQLEMRLTGHA
jgi:hypothetical protein